MGSKLFFPCISLLFLSWGLQVISQEADVKSALGDGGLEGILQHVKDNGGEASAVAALSGGGSIGDMTCMKKLMPCQSHMKSSSPPKTCCDPLKEMATEKEGECLCKVFNNQELLKTVNVTMDDALALTKACGVKVDTSVCKKATSSTSSPTSPPSPSKPADSSSKNSTDSSKESSASAKTTVAGRTVWSIASIATMMFSTLFM